MGEKKEQFWRVCFDVPVSLLSAIDLIMRNRQTPMLGLKPRKPKGDESKEKAFMG